jgi:hypothetical protein
VIFFHGGDIMLVIDWVGEFIVQVDKVLPEEYSGTSAI